MNAGLLSLEDERSLSAKLGTSLPALRKFDLAGWGIDPEPFLRDLAPSFNDLAWDSRGVQPCPSGPQNRGRRRRRSRGWRPTSRD
jgi:hypothetical protein